MAFNMKPKFKGLSESPRYAAQEKKDLGKYNVIDDIAATSPAKQTASQKKNLPEAIVKAIAAKSPAKQAKVNRDDGVQIKEVPAVVKEEVKKVGKKIGKKAKKIGKFFKKVAKKVGNTTVTKTKQEKYDKAKAAFTKLQKKQ
mgnify:FL=1|jgi:predicted sugar kinase|tara:strand:- start:2171 stop:2596 length:426 start_codon:yes stop_codon:yes gene_type:complete